MSAVLSSAVLSWNQRLQWLVAKTVSAQSLEQEIPSPTLNYNQSPSSNLASYILNFKKNACLKELPFLIELGLRKESVLFDYGCGLGRLAYAASKFLGTEGSYIGYEPNERALSFLKEAYGNRTNFKFYGDALSYEEDYIAMKSGEVRAGGKKAVEISLQDFIGKVVDIQYSSSVTTHMWLDAIFQFLKNLNSVVKPDGLCVNTWLIVDDFARYSLNCGMADRVLPYKVNDAYTYSTKNPLICTAYDLSDVARAYQYAGHEIVKILWGTWSGRGNDVHYQDIVISRPRA
jgi:SAM-dependent methyltransferase